VCAILLGSRPKSGSFSSSGRSESSAAGAGGASSGNETEEGELKARHLLVANHGGGSVGANSQRVLVKIRPPQVPARRHRNASCSTDGRQSSDDEEDDDDDDEEEGDSNSSALSGETDTSPAGRSIEGIPQQVSTGGSGNLKMRIVAPGRRRVISRPVLPRGSIQTRLVHDDAELFPGHHVHLTPKSAAKFGKLAHQQPEMVNIVFVFIFSIIMFWL